VESELACYDVFPKVVRADQSHTITIAAGFPDRRFDPHRQYEVSHFPCEEFSAKGRWPAGAGPAVRVVDGALQVTAFFEAEQEHVLQVEEVAAGQRKPVGSFRVYSLQDDLWYRRPYKGDFHIHSSRSDGLEPPAHVAAACRRIGLDFMAITDHHRYAPSLEAIDAFREAAIDLAVFPGEEVHPPDNPVHMINFGGRFSVNDLFKDEAGYREQVRRLAGSIPVPPAGVDPYEYTSCQWCFDRIRQAGGLGIFCHPYWFTSNRYAPAGALTSCLFDRQPFDAYEMIGGYFRWEADSNTLQVARYHEERLKGRRIPIVGASDSHGYERNELFGWYYTLVFSPSRRLDDLIGSVKSLYSVAVEAIPGETRRVYGPFRLVKYALFLLREVFPRHDELCIEEGRMMSEYLAGSPAAPGVLQSLRGRCDALLDHYWAAEGGGLVAAPRADGQAAGGRPALHAVGGEKQLLIDDTFFETSDRVALRLHPARKTGEANLERDREWESATLNWLNVMDDDGTYHMRYECYDVAGWPTPDDTSFCYAESEDAVHWTRPPLDLFAYREHPRTNILFRQIGRGIFQSRVHGVCVFKDPAADPSQRYKAVSQGVIQNADPPQRIAGMYSPDGLHWTRYPKPVCDVFADSQYSGFWDESRRKYVIYGRVIGRGRALGRSESADFAAFPPLSLVLQTDDRDPPETDLYNSAAMKYPYAANVYLMFPSLYNHTDETLDIRLAVSRDGVHWTWPERKPFIGLGEKGEFDCGSLYMGQGIIKMGNELWQYYGGARVNHKEGELEHVVKPENGRIFSRVVTLLDRYVSAEAGPAGGWFVTPALAFAGNILKFNVEVRDGGSVRVALLDEAGKAIAGRSIEDCVPITGDHTDILVRWKDNGDVTARAGRPTKMRVELVNAGLYAFRFTVGSADAGRDH
jgi:hypothetical protein